MYSTVKQIRFSSIALRKLVFALVSVCCIFSTIYAVVAQDNPIQLTGTEWEFETFNTSDSETPVALTYFGVITLHFETEKTFSGFSGCNGYFGSYQTDGGVIAIEGMFHTLMACFVEGVDVDIQGQEAAYLQALASATRYEIDGLILTIWYGENAEDALSFTAIAEEVWANTEWQLVSFVTFDSQEIETLLLEGSTITLKFGDDQKASGSGGCNQYSTAYAVADSHSLSIYYIASTQQVACEDAFTAQEQMYLQALDVAEHFIVDNDGSLTILYDDGRHGLRFIPLQTMPDSA